MTSRRPIPSITSQAISLLRFPLIVGVVFIHGTFYSHVLGADAGAHMPILEMVTTLCSNLIPQVRVPIFFIFSGYLFFFKFESWQSSLYLRNLKSRVRSLLIPYIFWSMLLYLAIKLMQGFVPIHTTGSDTTFPLSLWVADTSDPIIHNPLVAQFWFMRDLMVCVVISPLIYFIIYRTRHMGLLLLAAAWMVGYELPVVGPAGACMAALFFFSLGGWCARYKQDMAGEIYRLRWLGLLWPIFIALQFADFSPTADLLLSRLSILLGIIFCISLAVWLISRYNVKDVPLLTASSFFLYAYHVQWGESPIRRLLFAIVQPHSDLAYTAIYLGHILLTIIIGVGIYYLMSRYLPRFTRIITGGR